MGNHDWISTYEHIQKLGVRFKPHSKSGKMLLFSWLAGLFGTPGWKYRFWLTLGKTIYHPDSIKKPLDYPELVNHELVHVCQQCDCWSLSWWVFRYLGSWKFRWRMERQAYLTNVKAGASAAQIAHDLATAYRIKLPETVMRIWLEEHARVGQ